MKFKSFITSISSLLRLNSILFYLFFIGLLFYFSYLIYFFLLPIISLNVNESDPSTYERYYLNNTIPSLDGFLFLNVIEFNLPFFATDLLYMRVVLLLLFFFFIPIIISIAGYFLFVVAFRIELIKYIIYITTSLFLYYSNFILIYSVILNWIIKWLFLHSNNIVMFEFNVRLDVEFIYLLWFKLLFLNLLVSISYILFHKVTFLLLAGLLAMYMNIYDIGLNVFLLFYTYFLVHGFSSILTIFIILILIYFYCAIAQRKSDG